jgi:hypothetical protein
MKSIYKLFSILAFAGVLFMAACEAPEYQTPAPSSTVKKNNIMFINGLPDDSTVSFYVNNVQAGSGPIAAGGNTGYVSSPIGLNVYDARLAQYTTEIKSVGVGNATFPNTPTGQFPFRVSTSTTITKSGTTDPSIASPWFFEGTNFTMIAMGPVGARRRLTLFDNMSAVSATQAYVRTVNVVPTGVTVNFAASPVVTNITALSGRTYNQAVATVQPFTAIDPTLAYDVKNNLAVISTLPAGTFVAGKYYTVLVYRLSGNNAVTVITNK